MSDNELIRPLPIIGLNQTTSNNASTAPGVVAADAIRALKAASPCPAWKQYEAERVLCRDIYDGISALQKKGRVYLPQKQLETDIVYDRRLQTATFFNQFATAITSLSGRVFSREVKLIDAQGAWKDFQEDVDMEGNNLHVFCEEAFQDALIEGLSFILIDAPDMAPAKNREQEKLEAHMRRPYWVLLKATEVIGWKFERRDGRSVLVGLRTLQTKWVETSDFEFEERKVLRIYTLTTDDPEAETKAGVLIVEYLLDSGNNLLAPPVEKTIPMQILPIVPIYTERRKPFLSPPALHAMAKLCLRHYQSTSAQDHILDYSRFPILFGRRLQFKEGEVAASGASAMITSDEEGSDLRFVEHSGAAIKAGSDSLISLEERIALLSHEPLLRQSSGNETATRAVLDTATASSALQTWAGGLKDAIEQALLITKLWGFPGYDTAPNVAINTSHGLAVSQEEFNALITLRKEGQISRLTLWEELYRRGTLGPDFDAKIEEQRLTEEGGMSELGDGWMVRMSDAKIVSRERVFNTLKAKGLIPEEDTWEDEFAALSKEATGPLESMPGFNNALNQAQNDNAGDEEEDERT